MIHPFSAGDWIREPATPALIIDLDAMTANLDRLADHYRQRPVRVRPHAKMHKSPRVAREQLARGATGICVATLAEAEAMADAGIDDLLLTSAVVDPRMATRATALAHRLPAFRMVTDHGANVDMLAAAAEATGVVLRVLVDLDCGAHRTGVAVGPEAVALAERVATHRALRFEGFQAFASHLMHLEGHAARRAASREALAGVVETRRLAERAGLQVSLVSVGGTGTWDIDCEIDGVTDVQAGSYPFMDVMYRAIGGVAGPVFDDFAPALFVLTTAISQPVAGRITVDAGYKASATDHQPPEPWDLGEVSYRFAGDEHGILTLAAPSRALTIGSRVLLLPGHCDPTVNLYDHYWVVSGGRIVERWPVTGRRRSA